MSYVAVATRIATGLLGRHLMDHYILENGYITILLETIARKTKKCFQAYMLRALLSHSSLRFLWRYQLGLALLRTRLNETVTRDSGIGLGARQFCTDDSPHDNQDDSHTVTAHVKRGDDINLSVMSESWKLVHALLVLAAEVHPTHHQHISWTLQDPNQTPNLPEEQTRLTTADQLEELPRGPTHVHLWANSNKSELSVDSSVGSESVSYDISAAPALKTGQIFGVWQLQTQLEQIF
ncbi:hypothetical protein B0H10DRAFT_1941809 [Mycena sp. CBHHK59/15]|nr:hypothetical protein B0H10DRAFT_1941809 [Mycena sp. CBHHK59/15]